jgi:hypothetical protein
MNRWPSGAVGTDKRHRREGMADRRTFLRAMGPAALLPAPESAGAAFVPACLGRCDQTAPPVHDRLYQGPFPYAPEDCRDPRS